MFDIQIILYICVMKATKSFYLNYRNTFISLGFIEQVYKLDAYFELVMIYDKDGNLIKIL